MNQATIEDIKYREGEYWAERSRLLEEAKQEKVDKYYKDIEQQFDRSIEIIDNRVTDLYRRLAAAEDISLAEAKKQLVEGELKGFKMSLKDYIKYGRENAETYSPQLTKELERASIRYRISRLEATKLQLRAEVARLYSETDKITYNALAEIYEDQYLRNAFEIFSGTGVGLIDFSVPNFDAIDSVIRKPWRADGMSFMQRSGGYSVETMQKLADDLTRMLIQGEGYSVAAKRLAKIFKPEKDAKRKDGGALYKSKRLIYTEASFFQGQAQIDCYKELGIEKFQFHSELNTGVCDECGQMDGMIFKLSDKQVGVNFPPMHPFCRCTGIAYVDHSNVPGYIPERRAGRNKEGKATLFPADYTYEQWKKDIGKELEEKDK